jgi:hypothetical protein
MRHCAPDPTCQVHPIIIHAGKLLCCNGSMRRNQCMHLYHVGFRSRSAAGRIISQAGNMQQWCRGYINDVMTLSLWQCTSEWPCLHIYARNDLLATTLRPFNDPAAITDVNIDCDNIVSDLSVLL